MSVQYTVLNGQSLEVQKDIILNPITSTQRDALTPQTGAMIFNSTTNEFEGYLNGNWLGIQSSAEGYPFVAQLSDGHTITSINQTYWYIGNGVTATVQIGVTGQTGLNPGNYITINKFAAGPLNIVSQFDDLASGATPPVTYAFPGGGGMAYGYRIRFVVINSGTLMLESAVQMSVVG